MTLTETEQAGPTESARADVPGEPGLWVFIFGDLFMFTVYFVIFLVNRLQQPEAFAESRTALHQGLGGLNTIVLLTSSLLVAAGVRVIRRGYRSSPAWLFLAAATCAMAFCLVKIVEYHALIARGYSAYTNNFFLYYFVLTGFHLAHVIGGGVVLLVIFRMVRRRAVFSANQIVFIEGGSTWWHVVDILWLVLFALLYLAGVKV